MKKIVSTIAMLMLSSTSFAAKTENWSVVILPCSHDKNRALHFLLEQDEKNKDKFNGITNTIKIGVQDKPSDENKLNVIKQANVILEKTGLKKNTDIAAAINKNVWASSTNKLFIYLPLVKPITPQDKYQWITASEAADKTTNDETLQNLIKSKWKDDILTYEETSDVNAATFIVTATKMAEGKVYKQLIVYLDKKAETVFLKLNEKNPSLDLDWDYPKNFYELETSKDDAIFRSSIFPTALLDGEFWRVIFIDESKLLNKSTWTKMDIKKFENFEFTEDSKTMVIEEKNYTIPVKIFNALFTGLEEYKADKKLEEEKKMKEGGEAGEKKGDAEAGEIVYKFAETLSKLTKA